MSKKKVVLETDRKKRHLFRTSESGGRILVYATKIGFPWNDDRKIGEVKNFQDAIEVMKSFVDGNVSNVEISDL